MAGYYVHIPFCLKKCGYCDFVSYAGQQAKMEDYVDALMQEMQSYPSQQIETVFLGGGTPTTLSAPQIGRVLQAIRSQNQLDSNAEISIEVNPDTMTETLANALLDMGFSRFSIGLQSADDVVLRASGRTHDFATFEHCYQMLRHAGAQNINIDVMMGLPKQTYKSFGKTVDAVMDFHPEHVSVYELNLSEESPMGKAEAAGGLTLPPEEEVAAMSWELERLEKQLPRYEISNYAQPGYQCRHNLNYWQNGQYIGVGCAAHGCIHGGELRYSNPAELDIYLANPNQKATEQRIPKTEQMFETTMLGTRLIAGVDLAAFERRYGIRLDELIGAYVQTHPHLIENTGTHIRLTKRGLEIQNIVLVELLNTYFS